MSNILIIAGFALIAACVAFIAGSIHGRGRFVALTDALAKAKETIKSRDLSIAAVEANCRNRDGRIRLLEGDVEAANARIALMKPDYERGVARRKAQEKAKAKEKAARADRAAAITAPLKNTGRGVARKTGG